MSTAPDIDILNPSDRQRLLTVIEGLMRDPTTVPSIDADLFIMLRDAFNNDQLDQLIFLLDFISVLDTVVQWYVYYDVYGYLNTIIISLHNTIINVPVV